MSDFTFETENYITILLPIYLIIQKIIVYINKYHNEKIAEIVKIIIYSMSPMLTLLLLKLNYRNYFCAFFLIGLILSTAISSYVGKKTVRQSYQKISVRDKVMYCLSLLIGSIIIFLPYIESLDFICGGYDYKMDILYRGLYTIYGICFIVLNKYTTYKVFN
jgi:hypothetical protein